MNEDVEINHLIVFLGVEFTREEKLEMIRKRKEINYTGTRFQDCPFNEEQNKETIQTLAQTQARTLDGKIGIDGKELSTMDCFDLVKTPSPMPGINTFHLTTLKRLLQFGSFKVRN